MPYSAIQVGGMTAHEVLLSPFAGVGGGAPQVLGLPLSAKSFAFPNLVRCDGIAAPEGSCEALIASDEFPIPDGTKVLLRLPDGRHSEASIGSDCKQDMFIRQGEDDIHAWLGLTGSELTRPGFRLFAPEFGEAGGLKSGGISSANKDRMEQLRKGMLYNFTACMERLGVGAEEAEELLKRISQSLVRATHGRLEVWTRWGVLTGEIASLLIQGRGFDEDSLRNLVQRLSVVFEFHHNRSAGRWSRGERLRIAKHIIPPLYLEALFDRYSKGVGNLPESAERGIMQDVTPGEIKHFAIHNISDPEAGLRAMLGNVVRLSATFDAAQEAKETAEYKKLSDGAKARLDLLLADLSLTPSEIKYFAINNISDPEAGIRAMLGRAISLITNDDQNSAELGTDAISNFYRRFLRAAGVITA